MIEALEREMLSHLYRDGEDNLCYDFENCSTRLEPSGPYYKIDVFAAIYLTLGNYAAMARLLGRSRARVRDYVLKNEDVLEYWVNIRESILDDVEHLHFKAALRGDTGAQRNLLSTLGKDRGYVTRNEATGANGGPVAIALDPLTPEQWAEKFASDS